MAKYIKSHSNYVLKTKHQSTNYGTVYERDITTIGGRDQFARGQVPVYRSGNFVITTNNDYADYKKISDRDWHRNDEGEIWTLSTLSNYEKDEKSSYDKKIVIKKDYYDLRDFAYYGSCAELMRVSIEDILRTYPGELFIPYEVLYVKDDKVQYTKEAADAAWGNGNYECKKSGIKGYYTSYSQTPPGGITKDELEALERGIPYKRPFEYVTNAAGDALARKSLSLIDNPFDINMHSTYLPEGADPLKYFAENGISNYVGYLRDIPEDVNDCRVDDNWEIDKEHEYSLSIKDIIYDGIGERKKIKDIFKVSGNFCPPDESCNTDFRVNVISHEIIETTKEDEYCVEPGKYIGNFTICFNKIDHSFKTTPGLIRDKDGNPIEVCCDGGLDLEGKGGDTEIEEISSVRTDNECVYELKVYMFMGDDRKIKYLVDDIDAGGNIDVNYIGSSSDCADGAGAVLNTDFSGTFAENNFRARIRPKVSIIENYFNSLTSFERVLLNRHNDTLYAADFELIGENDYGFYTYTKRFTFPTTYGGYNLGSTNQRFTEYVASLSEIGEYYDELFTDNLWRSMTHEAIKNFDWTYARHYTPGEEEPFVEGGTKIQKIIRIYGREFDEINSYIEAIDDLNTVTYDNVNNLPDYFFTDKLEDYGWDVKLVYPLVLSEFVNGYVSTPVDINNLFPKKYDDLGNEITTAEAEKLNYFFDSDAENRNKITIKRVFNQDFSETRVKPYSCSNIKNVRQTDYGFAHPQLLVKIPDIKFDESKLDPCVSDSSIGVTTNPIEGEAVANGYHNECGDLIRIYCNENEFSSADANNEFLKRLILNSKELWKHKGTVDGMEMLLSLFGLRSKKKVFNDERYFVGKEGLTGGGTKPKTNFDVSADSIKGCNDNMNFNVNVESSIGNCLSLTTNGTEYYKRYTEKLYDLYDYDIKEYTLFTTRIEDDWDASKNMYNYDWINSTKLITYGTNDYEAYQGLPVSYREAKLDSGKKKRYLYPHFNSYDSYDGNPYYQMDGGWLQKKPFMFDTSDNIVIEKDELENNLFTETVKNIKCVNSLKELLSNHTLADRKGDICQVTDLSGRYAVIDGYVYDILTENEDSDPFDFIYATIENNSLSVGNAFFTDYVVISNPYEPSGKQKIDLTDEYYNNSEIKIYILKDSEGRYSIDVYSKETSISTFTVFENGKYMEGDNYTNYFVINDVDYYNELSVLGWRQLRSDEYEFYRMNTITDYRGGNNPHTGHMHYDNGHKYLTYFQSIFKYSYDYDKFDYRQYDDTDIEKLEGIENVGFKNLVDDDKCVVNYDSFLREDSKCHYFGTMISLPNREGVSCFSKRFDSKSIENANYKLIDVTRKSIIYDYDKNGDNMNPELRNLKYGSVYGYLGEDGKYNYEDIDSITDQIVNTKRMDIEFYIKNNNEYSKEWLEEVKYIDAVILPYLTQMIPSNVIWRVKYVTRDSVKWNSESGSKPCPKKISY